jgi:hypothetical protein
MLLVVNSNSTCSETNKKFGSNKNGNQNQAVQATINPTKSKSNNLSVQQIHNQTKEHI